MGHEWEGPRTPEMKSRAECDRQHRRFLDFVASLEQKPGVEQESSSQEIHVDGGGVHILHIPGCLVAPTTRVGVLELFQSSYLSSWCSLSLCCSFFMRFVLPFWLFSRFLSHVVFCRPGVSSPQVVVSGPAGFVFFAEGLLVEMGIPPQAVVLLD